MTEKDLIPNFLAKLLTDDVQTFLRIGPGPVELVEYYQSLLDLVAALEAAVAEVQATTKTVIDNTVIG